MNRISTWVLGGLTLLLVCPALLAADDPKIDRGDTAWMIAATALVLFMVPGLALFYAGMVRHKNILGTMMHSLVALGIVGVQWILVGYALAFGETQGGWIGWSPGLVGLLDVKPQTCFPGTNIPIYLHCMYQGMFAIITPALISGALAERVRFGPYCLFILLWSTLVYDPLAHWVWAADGWLNKKGALDFAGGTVVHISAGFSALAAILVLPRRRGYPEHAIHPSGMTLTLLGAGMLWFGWFGFNGGSALAANGLAVLALTNTQVAAAAAALAWMLVERFHRGKPTALGFASGLVAGLVAITPAAGYVHPTPALVIGALAGLVCYGAVSLKPGLKYDDSLDAFGVHGIGGLLGAVLTGVFASGALWNQAQSPAPLADLGKVFKDGAVVSGGQMEQVGVQVLASLAAALYGVVLTVILVKGIDLVLGFNLKPEDESEGLDLAVHGEVAFDLAGGPEEALAEVPLPAPRPATTPPDGHDRFTVRVEGPDPAKLRQAWSELCQVSETPPSPEFRAVYPYVTTIQGNRFRCRGGDRSLIRASLQRLFQDRLGDAIRTHIEE